MWCTALCSGLSLVESIALPPSQDSLEQLQAWQAKAAATQGQSMPSLESLQDQLRHNIAWQQQWAAPLCHALDEINRD